MAVPSFIEVAPTASGAAANTIYSGTLGAAANSGKITTGKDMIIHIIASGPIAVRFGASATITAAGATDIYVPANTPWIVDMGHQNDSIWIYSFNATTIITVSQVGKN